MPCTVDYPKLTLTHPVLPSQSPLPALDPVSGNGNKGAYTISRRPWLRYLGVSRRHTRHKQNNFS